MDTNSNDPVDWIYWIDIILGISGLIYLIINNKAMKKILYILSYVLFIPIVIEMIIRGAIVTPIQWICTSRSNAWGKIWFFDIMVNFHTKYFNTLPGKKLVNFEDQYRKEKIHRHHLPILDQDILDKWAEHNEIKEAV